MQIMQKAYNRLFWENFPSDKTPVDEIDLNIMDIGIDENDNRIVYLSTTKLDKSDAQTMVKKIEFYRETGTFKITYYNGAFDLIDTMLEKIAVNFDFDPVTQKLIIIHDDGTEVEVDLSALITQYEFLDSNTIAFYVNPDGKVSAGVKEGSIEEKHLRPNYLADIKVEAAKAEASARAASQSEINAKVSENAATKSASNASDSAESAFTSESNAFQSALNALSSAQSASEYAKSASQDAEIASQSAEISTEKSEQAQKSEELADYWAKLAESHNHGGTGIREGENTDNSKYWSERSKDDADRAKIEADKAAQYADITAPDFYLDMDNMELYIKDGVGVDFILDGDDVLYWAVV